MNLILQHAQTRGASSLDEHIAEIVKSNSYDTLGVAVAYASVAGVRTFLNALSDIDALTRSYWLLGLDDCITPPSVLELVADIPGAFVRVAGERVNKQRFHPKVIWLSTRSAPSTAALVVGSANLTLGGLRENVETVVASQAINQVEARRYKKLWQELWLIGRVPDNKLLSAYRSDFDSLQRGRINKRPLPGNEVLASDFASIDPSRAKVCWIEVGNITGFQSEQLEIKGEQALFFGLPIVGSVPIEVAVGLTSGKQVNIPVRYYGNAMWRFNLPAIIPEVSKGLRPGGRRSPYVAIFDRSSGVLRLSFITVTGRDFKRLRKISMQAGTLGSTSAREYGWF